MSAELLVETKQHGPVVEAGPMDEPNPGEHATQVQHSELLAQADVLLDGLGDAQMRVDETLSRPGPSRAYPVASFGRRTSQNVKELRRGPARQVRTPARLVVVSKCLVVVSKCLVVISRCLVVISKC